MQVNWKARSEEHGEGLTSPEELIAAAHAACFCMAFSARLAERNGLSVLDGDPTSRVCLVGDPARNRWVGDDPLPVVP